jgi:hypothetical protein
MVAGLRQGLGPSGALLAVVALLVSASPALAGTVTLETGRDGGIAIAWVVYRATPGTSERIAVNMFRADDIPNDRFEGYRLVGFRVGARVMQPGAGCEAVSQRGRISDVVCPLPAGARPRGPHVHAGDRADEVSLDVPAPGALVFLGPGSDSLFATVRGRPESPFTLHMYGGPGNDVVEAAGTLHGGPGADTFEVTEGASRIFGGAGNDDISASDRADTIVPGPGRDVVFAYPGADLIRARDGVTDIIDCDLGRDAAEMDSFDTSDPSVTDGPLDGCERLRRRGEPRPISPLGFWSWDNERYVSLSLGCPPDGPPQCVGDVTLNLNGRAIARRPLLIRAGTWGDPEFALGRHRIRRLIGRKLVVVIHTLGRRGQLLTTELVESIERVGPPDYDSARRRASIPSLQSDQ